VHTGTDYAVLRLEKTNYKLVLAELEKRSGKKVESIGENKYVWKCRSFGHEPVQGVSTQFEFTGESQRALARRRASLASGSGGSASVRRLRNCSYSFLASAVEPTPSFERASQ
jgi:hypothetical protein